MVAARTPAIDLDTYDRLVRGIYDAALDIERWRLFLHELARALNAPSSILRVQDLQTKQVGIYITDGIDPHYQQQYRDYFVHIDPLMSLPDRYPSEAVLQLATCMPASYKQSEYYNDYAVPQGMEHVVGCFPVRNNNRVAVLGVQRPHKNGLYNEQEVALMEHLVPHLQRGFQISSLLMACDNKVSATCELLQRLHVGVVLVDAESNVVFTNAQAEALLRQETVLQMSANKLQLKNSADNRSLQKLIYDASYSDVCTGGSLSLKQAAMDKTLNVTVVPINRDIKSDFTFGTVQATAAVFIASTEQTRSISEALLAQLYGMSPAEARLAAALANGESLEQIAEQFELSKNTLRSQLKACFHKTGTRRQAELVRLILCDPVTLLQNTDI